MKNQSFISCSEFITSTSNFKYQIKDIQIDESYNLAATIDVATSNRY